MSFKNKIGILKNGTWTYLDNENSQLPLGSFNNLFVGSDDNLWADVFMPRIKSRIFKYDLAAWKDHTKQLSNSGLRNNYVKNLVTDDSDNKWIVNHLLEDTLTQIKGSNWNDFDISNISELNALFTLRYDSDTLKIWNDNSIVIRYDLKKNIWSLSDNTKSQSSDMKIDDSGAIWWCVGKGLQKYNGTNWESFLSQNTVASICFDNSNTLYASTLPPVDKPGRIFSYKNNNWEEMITCSGDAKWVYSMTVDTENNLWFGVLDRLTVGYEFGNGLYKYDGQNLVHYDIANSEVPSNSVAYVKADKDDNIWVGTYGGGLGLFKDNVWKSYNASNSPLSVNSVEIIERDRQGNVWANCQFNGITFIPYSEFGLTATEDIDANSVNAVKVYPNPSFGNLSIDFTLDKGSLCDMTLYDVCGKKVFSSKQKYYPSGVNTESLNFSENIQKGMYFLEIRIGAFTRTKKVLIQ